MSQNPLTPGKESFNPNAALTVGSLSTPMLIAIGVYSFAWIVSLFVVVVHTKRESVALKRDIALLKERQKHHLSNPLVQQPLNKYPPNHIQPQMSSSPLTPTSNPATANKNINPALRISVTPAASPRFTPLQAADSTDDEKFPSSENKEDEDDPWGSALVVPSTPETNNLILALAAGDDLDRAIFDDFDASGLPPSLDPVALAIHEHDEETSQSRSASVLRRFSSLKQHQHHHQSTIPSAFTSNHKHNKLLNRTGSLSSIATSSIHGASSKYLSPDLNQAGSGINGKGLNLPVLSGNGRSVSSVAESVIFVPSQTQSRPNLLLRASALPHNPNLWRRMFTISSPKFLPEDTDAASKYAPGSAARARFVEPHPPLTPLASRVHRLILAAIDADLRVLEARFKKDAVRYPPVLYTFLGFQLLAIFLFVFGQGLTSWPAGLPTFLLVAGVTLGCEVLACVLVRDLLTDLKAERAVCVLSLKRVQARAPYYLSFTASTYRYRMRASEYACIPLVFLLSWWAVPLARRAFGDTDKVYVKGPPRSEGGACGLDEVPEESSSDGACVVLNGRLRPTVWNVSALLRMPHTGVEEGRGMGVGNGLGEIEIVVSNGKLTGSQDTVVASTA